MFSEKKIFDGLSEIEREVMEITAATCVTCVILVMTVDVKGQMSTE